MSFEILYIYTNIYIYILMDIILKIHKMAHIFLCDVLLIPY